MPRLVGALLAVATVAGTVAAIAVARPTSARAGDPKAGKTIFTSTCGACHKMKAAKTVGTIGPDLDATASKLTQAQIVKAVSLGGASIMSKAALAKYPTRMVAYKSVLSAAQIQNVAAYVYVSTHAGAATAAPVVKATLKAAGHKPKIGAKWTYVVHALANGKPTAGKITVQIVDPMGKAHPVKYGNTKKNVVKRAFKGAFKSFVVWPKSSKGVTVKFRVTVLVGKAKKVINYKVTPRA